MKRVVYHRKVNDYRDRKILQGIREVQFPPSDMIGLSFITAIFFSIFQTKSNVTHA